METDAVVLELAKAQDLEMSEHSDERMEDFDVLMISSIVFQRGLDRHGYPQLPFTRIAKLGGNRNLQMKL